MTESKAAQLLHQYFPYCVLSEVPLFRPDTSESHLYAHKLDFLLHLKRDEEEKLVIIECKDNILKGKKGGRPISEESKMWVAQYFGAVKDARKQVRSQTRALYHNLDLQRNGQPKIEGWVVHSGRHSAEIRHDYDDGVTLMALTPGCSNRSWKECGKQDGGRVLFSVPNTSGSFNWAATKSTSPTLHFAMPWPMFATAAERSTAESLFNCASAKSSVQTGRSPALPAPARVSC